MQKQDFETCQKRFQDFEILPKFSETHVLPFEVPFATPICYHHPSCEDFRSLDSFLG